MPKEIRNFASRLRRRLARRLEPPLELLSVEYEYGWDAVGDKAVFVEVGLDPDDDVSEVEFRVIEQQVADIFQREGVHDWVYVNFVDVED